MNENNKSYKDALTHKLEDKNDTKSRFVSLGKTPEYKPRHIIKSNTAKPDIKSSDAVLNPNNDQPTEYKLFFGKSSDPLALNRAALRINNIYTFNGF